MNKVNKLLVAFQPLVWLSHTPLVAMPSRLPQPERPLFQNIHENVYNIPLRKVGHQQIYKDAHYI